MASPLARNSSSGGKAMANLPYPQRFLAAAEFVGFPSDRDLQLTLSNETSLLLYALYMQATTGQCNAPKPSIWNAVDFAKWTSWNKLADMNKAEAMRLFVRTLEEEEADWFDKMQSREAEPEASGERPVQDNDLKPSTQDEDVPVVNDSPPSPPPPVSTNGGISLDGKIQENATECEIIKDVADHNQWVSPSVSGRRPTARYEHAAAVVDHRMFVIGGNHNGRYLNDVQVLDLRTLTWSKLDQSPTLPPCAGHSLIRRNNLLLVVGGHSKGSSETVTVHALDTETLTWSLLPTYGQAPVARRGQSVSLVGSGLVMFGGEDDKRRLLNDLNIFDLETMTWEAVNAVGVPPSPRADHAAGVYDGRYIYIFGGGSHSSCFNDLHVLDLESMEWSRKESDMVLSPRSGHASVTIGDHWYIVGGGDNKGGVSETVVLNMETLDWSTVTSVPARTYIACEGLSLVSAVLNGEETLVAFGGYNGRYSNETHVLKTGLMQAKASPVASFGNHISDVSSESEPREIPENVRHVENGGYSTPKVRELEATLAATQDENAKLKQDMTLKTQELSKELQSVRGQFVAEQSRCFKLEVEVAELRQKLQSMETLQKELDLLRKQKNASDEAMAAAMASQKQGSGVWKWLSGTQSDSADAL